MCEDCDKAFAIMVKRTVEALARCKRLRLLVHGFLEEATDRQLTRLEELCERTISVAEQGALKGYYPQAKSMLQQVGVISSAYEQAADISPEFADMVLDQYEEYVAEEGHKVSVACRADELTITVIRL